MNFRCNKNFNDDVIAALAEGIMLKKELRVSYNFQFSNLAVVSFRLLIWERITFQTLAYRSWVRPSGHMCASTCSSWIQTAYPLTAQKVFPNDLRTSKI